MSYIPQFIKLYADDTTAARLKTDPTVFTEAFDETLEVLMKQPNFSSQQEFVGSLRQEITNDNAIYDTPDTAQQIIECLKRLMRVAVYDDSPPGMVMLKIRTLRRLFMRIYSRTGTKWTKAQMRHVWFVSERLAGWKTYFLSYTNSGATIVNDEYKSIIRVWADPKVRKSRNPDEDNILVDAMVNWFARNKMSQRSFYDKKKIEAGDYLEDEIAPAIKNTLAFVQLVQLDTFSTAAKVNWSYAEYDLFNRCTERMIEIRKHYKLAFETRFIPVLAGDPEKLELEDYELPKQYWPWKKRIFDKTHYLHLPREKQKFDDVMGTLKKAIIRRACRIIESVPD